MAANKIILKIEEDGAREAAEIVDAAKKKAAASAEKITAAAKVKIEEINARPRPMPMRQPAARS